MNAHPTPPAGGTPEQPGPNPAQPYPGQPYPGQPAPGQPYSGQPVGGPAAPPEQPKRNWFARHKVLTGIGVVIALIVVGSALGGGGDDDAPSAAKTTATTEAPQDDARQDAVATDDEAADDDAADDEKAEEPAEPADQAPGVGDTVRDGKFEFVVTEVTDGGKRIGSKDFGVDAQGRFVLVHITVTNVGDEPQMLYSGVQALYDAQGREFGADTTAALYLDSADTILGDINPGNSVTGVIVYDLPKDAEPASIELHDGMFSGGVTVSLT